MEQAQSQDSCRIPLLCLSCLKPAFSSSTSKGEARRGDPRPPCTHRRVQPSPAARPCSGEMPRGQNTKARHGHLQGLSPPRGSGGQREGATKPSGMQAHGKSRSNGEGNTGGAGAEGGGGEGFSADKCQSFPPKGWESLGREGTKQGEIWDSD